MTLIVLIQENSTLKDKEGKSEGRLYTPVWLRNRLISVKLEPVLNLFEKSCIALYYMHFPRILKI